MTKGFFLRLSVIALALGGCAQMNTAAQDAAYSAQNTSNTSRMANDDQAGSLLNAGSVNRNCPAVHVIDELSTLSEFADPARPGDDTLISRVQLQEGASNCIYSNGSVRVDVKLVFESVLGQRGKMQAGDTPFFSYPFFIAVTDGNNNILAKEVFAASMTYDSNETRHTYYENLRQIIPIDRREDGPRYSILVGFQLSEQQLSYNRETMVLQNNRASRPGAGIADQMQRQSQNTAAPSPARVPQPPSQPSPQAAAQNNNGEMIDITNRPNNGVSVNNAPPY